LRTIPFLAGLLLATALLTLVPDADARSVACTSETSSTCPGWICVDKNLDGHLTSNECIIIYCVNDCCGTCPDPY
jgi:hypothetical protein